MGAEILFRADGSKTGGFGHLTRSLCLAKALEALNQKVSFISANLSTKASQFFKHHGVSIKNFAELADGKGNHTTHAAPFCHIAEMERISSNITILDSYQIDDAYRLALKQCGKTVISIDDIYSHFRHSHMVINQNLSAEGAKYGDYAGKMLLGSCYALIDPLFSQMLKPAAKFLPEVLLIMGGTDATNITGRMLSILDNMEERFSIRVATGFYETELPTASRHDCTIESMGTEAANLIATADVAITAGGTTCMELAAAGRPFCGFLTDEHQQENLRFWGGSGAALYGGNPEKMSDEEITSAIRNLFRLKKEWASMGEKGQNLIDGGGAERAAMQILRFINQTN